MPTIKTGRLVGLLLLFVIVGCGGDEVAESTESDRPVLSGHESLRIGSLDSGGPETFGEIRDILVSPGGSILVLDYLAQEIRVFGSDGTFERTIGGKGEGPGEFQAAVGMDWGPRGTLWVNDPANGRVSELDSTGAFVEAHPRAVGTYGGEWVGGISQSGRIAETTVLFSGRISRESGLEQAPPSAVVSLDPTTGQRDTVLSPFPPSRFYRLPFGAAAVPFSGREWISTDHSNATWFGHTSQYRIFKIDLRGDTVAVVQGTVQPQPVSAQERQEEIDALVSRMQERGSVVDLDYSVIPDRKPVIEQFFTDSADRLWVRRAGSAELIVFDVYGPDGESLAQANIEGLELAVFPRPVVVGTRMYGVVRDDLGVDHVVVVDFPELPSANGS